MSDIQVDLTAEGAFETTGDEVFKTDENRSRCASFISAKIIEARDGTERAELMERWETWRRHRMARPKDKTKNTPWPNAANMATTKTATNTNVMFGKLKTMIQGREPRMVCKARSDQYREHARVIGQLFNFINESPLHVNLPKHDQTILYETPSMGTQVVDLSWDARRMHKREAGAEGAEMVPVDKTLFEGPMPNPILLDQFLFPQGYTDVQRMPWCSIEMNYMGYELRQLAALGFFKADVLDGVLGAPQTATEDYEDQANSRMGLDPEYSREGEERFTISKVYMFWDTDDDGQYDDILVWVHADTGTILRAEYNVLGKRPIVRFPFINVPGQFYAMGIGWLSELGQEELDTWRNIRINSTSLSSLQMMAVKRGGLLKSDETFKPGKLLQVNNPAEDVRPIGFPDTSGSTLQAEIVASRELDTAVAMSDIQRGNSDQVAKSGVGVGQQMLLAQRGDSIFESVSADIRAAYSELYMLQLELCVMQKERAKQWLLPLVTEEADKQYAQEVFDMPIEDVPFNFAFVMETTPVMETKEMQRQTVMTKMQLFDMYTQSIMQLLGMMTQGMPGPNGMPQPLPPPMQEFVMQALLTKHKLMEEALNALGSPNAEDLVGYYKDLEVMRNMIEMQKDAQVAQMKGGLNGQAGTGVQAGAAGAPGAGGMGETAGFGGAPAAPGAAPGGTSGVPGQF